LKAAISGDEKNFAVFLRPFYTTDKIQTTQMIMILLSFRSIAFQTIGYKLEDMIVKAFHRRIPVVALGKPGETFGVGRILADEEAGKGPLLN
jgi:hypothetical protein